MSDPKPVLGPITRARGVAGQISYSVRVTYAGEDASTVTFVGNTLGGPVLMITTADPRGTFVTDPNRFGAFSPEWVQRFFA